jgi:hypothetical protein
MSASTEIGRFFRAIDERNWTMVSDLLAPQVDLDYTSLFGGDTERRGRDDVVARWSAMLPGFDATQHLIGPLLETAAGRYECNVRAYHHLDDDTWMVAGWYRLTTTAGPEGSLMLAGITLAMSYETGPRSLIEQARQRTAGSAPPAAPTEAPRGEPGTSAGSG